MKIFFKLAGPDAWLTKHDKHTCLEHALSLDHDWKISFTHPADHKVILYVWGENHELLAAVDVTRELIECSNVASQYLGPSPNRPYWRYVANRLCVILKDACPEISDQIRQNPITNTDSSS